MVVYRLKHFLNRYPLTKGMLAYIIMWPTGNIIQQTMDGKRWDTYDWNKCTRFAMYGTLFVAPTLYGWVRVSSKIWPVTNFRTAVSRAMLDQFTYGPAATASFFFFMSLMEHKTLEQSKQEVCEKFWPTIKIGACYWMVIQTLNYSLIPERNRVPVISLFGLVWTIFLAYMKQKSHVTASNAANVQFVDYNNNANHATALKR